MATPQLSIAIADTTLDPGQSTTITLIFSEKVTGFGLSDISAPGNVSGLTSTDAQTWTLNYQVPVSSTPGGTLYLAVLNNSFQSISTNSPNTSEFYAAVTINMPPPAADGAPTVGITFADSTLDPAQTTTVTFAFSEAVTNFSYEDITAPGWMSNLTSTDGGKTWTATYKPAPQNPGDLLPVHVLGGQYADLGGTPGLPGTATATITAAPSPPAPPGDISPPTVTVSMADSTLTVGQTTTVTFTFSEIVKNFSYEDITAPGWLSNLTSTDGGKTWTATYKPASTTVGEGFAIGVLAQYTDLANLTGGPGHTEGVIVGEASPPPPPPTGDGAPTVGITFADSTLDPGQTTTVTFAFSEAVMKFSYEDITAPGWMSNLTSADGGKTWTATYKPAPQNPGDLLLVQVLGGQYFDLVGTPGLPGSATASITAPQAPVDETAPIMGVVVNIDDVGDITGNIGLEKTTDDTRPTISSTGAAAPGDSVSVVVGGQTLTTKVGTDGKWSVTPVAALAEGSYTPQITMSDAAGNTATGTAPTFTVDTTAPVLGTIVNLDNVGTVTGAIATGGFTNDNTPTVSGTGASKAGDKVTIVLGGQTLTTTVAADGSWSVTPPTPLADGQTYTPVVTITDAAGNKVLGNAPTFTVDTVAPVLGSMVSMDNFGSVVGAIPAGGSTDDTTPTIGATGASKAGDKVSVVLGGQTLTTTVAADGSWSVTPTTPLTDGQTYTPTVSITDAAGNTATGMAPTFTVDTTAPVLGTIVNLDNVGTVTGAIATGGFTNDNTPTVSGTGASKTGDKVSVVLGGQTLTTTVAADGSWSVTPPTPLADGQTYTSVVTITDAAGNKVLGNAPTFTVDTVAPVLGNIVSMDNFGSVVGAIPAGGSTDDTTPTIGATGASKAGDKVTVVLGGQTLTTTVAADGSWSVTPTTPLTDGQTYTPTVSITDAAGNTVTGTATTFTIGLNAAPVDGDEAITVVENEALTPVNLLANATDANNDTLSFGFISKTGTHAALVSVNSIGELSIDSNNTVLDSMVVGETSIVTVTYQVSDGKGGSNTSTATVTITGDNDAPKLAFTTLLAAPAALLPSLAGGAYGTLISLTETEGEVASSTAPAGWEKNAGTVDIVSLTEWGQWGPALGISGPSPAGGNVVGSLSSSYALESASTMLTGLEAGSTYTFALAWQEAALLNAGNYDFKGGGIKVYVDGELKASASGADLSYGADAWKNLNVTFQAVGASADVIVEIDETYSESPSTTASGGAIVWDAYSKTQLEAALPMTASDTGVTVGSLLASTSASDVDKGDSIKGYAFIAAPAQTAASDMDGVVGKWQYRTSAQGQWTDFPADISQSNALYLDATASIRWMDNDSVHTGFSVVAVDTTADEAISGQTLDASVRGGNASYSQEIAVLPANTLQPLSADTHAVL